MFVVLDCVNWIFFTKQSLFPSNCRKTVCSALVIFSIMWFFYILVLMIFFVILVNSFPMPFVIIRISWCHQIQYRSLVRIVVILKSHIYKIDSIRSYLYN